MGSWGKGKRGSFRYFTPPTSWAFQKPVQSPGLIQTVTYQSRNGNWGGWGGGRYLFLLPWDSLHPLWG